MQSSSNRHQSKRRSENEATSSNLQTSTNHYPFSDQSNTLLRPSNSGASFNAALHLPTDTSGRLLYQTPPPPSFNSVPFFDEFFDEELELLPVWSNDCPQGNELQYETHTSMPALNAFFFDLQRLAGTVQDVFIIPQNNPYTGSLPVPHSEAFGLVGDANLLRNDTAPVVDKYRQPNQAVTEYEWRLESLWADLGLPSQLSEKANIAPPYLDLPSVPNLSFSVESSPGPSGLETVLSWSRKGVDTSVDAVYDSDVERYVLLSWESCLFLLFFEFVRWRVDDAGCWGKEVGIHYVGFLGHTSLKGKCLTNTSLHTDEQQ